MKLERQGAVAVLRLNEGKGNSIGPAFLHELNAKLGQLGDAGALVIVGGGSFFSVGLDLPALLALDRPAMTSFMESFSATMLRVFELPLPVVAAVNGHAIAGGCVLALQADHRIMADVGAARIGLNEVKIGLGLPPLVIETLRSQVPAESLGPIALEANLYDAKGAVAIGLVDEAVPAAELEGRAVAKAGALAGLNRGAFRSVKAALRRPTVEAIRAENAREAGSWVSTWFSEEGQALLRHAVQLLQSKR